MAYATVEEYVAWAGGSSPSAGETTLITMCLDAAAEAIDGECFRTFTSASSATSGARTYRVKAGQTYLFVDDFTVLTSVTIDGTSAAVTVMPVDEGRPYTTLKGTFDTDSDAVVVTAQWGWPATPKNVKLANLLLAAKLDQRRQSPNGIERGGEDIGFIRILGVDKDVQELLKKYVRAARSFA